MATEESESLTSTPFPQMKSELIHLLETTSVSSMDLPTLCLVLKRIAEVAQQEGIAATSHLLQAMVDDDNDHHLHLGFDMLCKGTEPELIREILEMRTETLIRQMRTRCEVITAGLVEVQKSSHPELIRIKLESLSGL